MQCVVVYEHVSMYVIGAHGLVHTHKHRLGAVSVCSVRLSDQRGTRNAMRVRARSATEHPNERGAVQKLNVVCAVFRHRKRCRWYGASCFSSGRKRKHKRCACLEWHDVCMLRFQ